MLQLADMRMMLVMLMNIPKKHEANLRPENICQVSRF